MLIAEISVRGLSCYHVVWPFGRKPGGQTQNLEGGLYQEIGEGCWGKVIRGRSQMTSPPRGEGGRQMVTLLYKPI